MDWIRAQYSESLMRSGRRETVATAVACAPVTRGAALTRLVATTSSHNADVIHCRLMRIIITGRLRRSSRCLLLSKNVVHSRHDAHDLRYLAALADPLCLIAGQDLEHALVRPANTRQATAGVRRELLRSLTRPRRRLSNHLRLQLVESPKNERRSAVSIIRA